LTASTGSSASHVRRSHAPDPNRSWVASTKSSTVPLASHPHEPGDRIALDGGHGADELALAPVPMRVEEAAACLAVESAGGIDRFLATGGQGIPVHDPVRRLGREQAAPGQEGRQRQRSDEPRPAHAFGR
jgi:hypothetical protein